MINGVSGYTTKPTVKKIVKKFNKGISRRKISREADNYRKSLRRELSKEIELATGIKVKPNKSIEEYARTHNVGVQAKNKLKEIESSYAQFKKGTKQKVGYNYDVMKARENTGSFQRNIARKNKMFQSQMNLSTKKGGLSLLSKAKTKTFYAATRDLFAGTGDSRQFNQKIMDKFGEKKLENVYNLITDKDLDYNVWKNEGGTRNEKEWAEVAKKYGFNSIKDFDRYLEQIDKRINLWDRREVAQKEIERLERLYKNTTSTEDATFNESNDMNDVEGSPEELNRVISAIATALNYA